jgi:hypothetical protein
MLLFRPGFCQACFVRPVFDDEPRLMRWRNGGNMRPLQKHQENQFRER